MKTLLLFRHAKSSWNNTSLSDFDRPLNAHGEFAAPFMGQLIRSRGLLPDLVISSPAIRAKSTAELAAAAADLDGKLIFDERIYEASPNTLVKVASDVSDDVSSLMLVGHNPGMEGCIRYLTGEVVAMPTAGLAVIELPVEHWSEVAAGVGKLLDVIRPKDEVDA